MPRKPKAYDVRLADLMTFLTLRKDRSVTATARSLGTTPSQVSKSMARLERQVGERLFARSTRGVTPTGGAERVLPHITMAVDALLKARRGARAKRDVTVVAPSYLLQAIVPALARDMDSLRFRGVQLGGGAIRAQMGLRQFEVAFFTGEAGNLPPSWRAERIGQLGYGLFAPPALWTTLPSGRVPVDALRALPFVIPVSFDGGAWHLMDDLCPLPAGERHQGHEAPTISLALAIAAEAGQLVFGPRTAAHDFVKHRRLVEVSVEGWQVSQPTSLAVDIDRITQSELKQVRAIASAVLAQGR